jgi:sigma-E factor negative regulatory protein RseC
MIEEQGTVVAVQSKVVIVEVVRTSACQSCKAKQGCGQAVLSEWGDESKQQAKNHFAIPTEQPLKVGDSVVLGMQPDVISLVALLVYILPLMTAVGALSLGLVLGFNEAVQLLLFVFGLLSAYGVMRHFSFIQTARLTPEILRVYGARQDNVIASSN